MTEPPELIRNDVEETVPADDASVEEDSLDENEQLTSKKVTLKSSETNQNDKRSYEGTFYSQINKFLFRNE